MAQSAPPAAWEANQQTIINSDLAAGRITAEQAAALRNRAAQIQAQQQAFMNQHGGLLTGQEKHLIDHELSGVNKAINHDVKWNANNGVNGVPGMPPAWQQSNPAWQRWQTNSAQPWQYGAPGHWQNANYVPGANPQWQSTDGYYHHKYHHGNKHDNGWSNGWNNSNGSYNGWNNSNNGWHNGWNNGNNGLHNGWNN